MKTSVVILVLVIISVIASPEDTNQNNDSLPIVSESPLQHKSVIETTKNDDIKQDDDQENINVEADLSNEVTENYGDAEVDIVIAESIESAPNEFILPEASTPLEETPNELIPPDPLATLLYEGELREPQTFNPYADDNVILKEPGEIMQTAEGFVPIPIFRNRQKQRRRFVTRRNFQRNPYSFRRFQLFYPYSFYHPSSLRYYRF